MNYWNIYHFLLYSIIFNYKNYIHFLISYPTYYLKLLKSYLLYILHIFPYVLFRL